MSGMDRHRAMDRTCRSERDREIWMKAEANAIARWQNKVSRLFVDVISVRAALGAALEETDEYDIKAHQRLDDAFGSADRLVEFVRQHSGGNPVDDQKVGGE